MVAHRRRAGSRAAASVTLGTIASPATEDLPHQPPCRSRRHRTDLLRPAPRTPPDVDERVGVQEPTCVAGAVDVADRDRVLLAAEDPPRDEEATRRDDGGV